MPRRWTRIPLFQGFYDRRKEGNAPPLSDSFPAHNVKHIPPPGLFTPCQNPRPPGFGQVIGQGVVFADMVCDNLPRVVRFNAADNVRVKCPVWIA